MMPLFSQNNKYGNCETPYCPSDTYDNNKETTGNGRLYNDDIIILALIFFLYSENTNDTYLLIALFMLLLS